MRLQDLADALGLQLLHPNDAEITGIASMASAQSSDLVFVEDPRYLESALDSGAGAIIAAAFAAESVSARPMLIAANPRLAFALSASLLARAGTRATGVHPSAVVHPSAILGPGVSVGAQCYIAEGVRIGQGTQIGPGCVIGADISIGEDCELVARVTIHSHTTIGDRTVIHAGAVLGGDGFGFVPDPATGRFHKFPQIGRLDIGNDVEIGANVTIDRGALEATVISDGVKLDNMVHVGHNAFLGRNVVIAAQSGVSGSSHIADNVLIGGQVGIADHVRIEEGAILGAQAGIPSKKVIRGKGVVFWGTPARPIKEYLKELAVLARLASKK
ncbi:MAG TPA: UDP-3-O-(3-hydroxymyristoyl)glucosamine N-acyltransferase [Clostridia bacterium]|nr:UDP-3-O-(3-hydroxymyristoyl)glucosamine N-acyltransferase [Clostridia bacterium]